MPAFQSYALDLADADTLSEFYSAQTSTQSDFIQMSLGPALLTATCVDLGDMRLVQVNGHGRHLWIDRIIRNEWRFAVLAAGGGGPKLGGHEITANTGHLLRPGDSADFHTFGDYETIEVTFDVQLVEQLGWHCTQGQIRLLPSGTADVLVSRVKAAIKSARRADENLGTRFSKPAWRDVIFDSLDLALSPWHNAGRHANALVSRPAHMDVIHKVRPLLRDMDLALNLSVGDLAREAGVAKRSLCPLSEFLGQMAA